MMIPGGYILQPRVFDRSRASKMSPCAREVWFYILRNVNHKDGKQFKRGEGFFNSTELMEALSWYVGYRKKTYSKTQITKALRRLCEDSLTTTTKTTRGFVVSVCNYDLYQAPSNYEDNNEDTTKTQRRLSHGNTINKNVKNERMKELKKTTKNIYGEFENVKLTDNELTNLKNKFPDFKNKIEKLSSYMASKGKTYKSHYATILNWARKDNKSKTTGSLKNLNLT